MGRHNNPYTPDKKRLTREQALRFKAARERAGILQKHAAEMLQTDRRNFGKIESGDAMISPAQLSMLCEKYGASAEWVLGGGGGGPADWEPDEVHRGPRPGSRRSPHMRKVATNDRSGLRYNESVEIYNNYKKYEKKFTPEQRTRYLRLLRGRTAESDKAEAVQLVVMNLDKVDAGPREEVWSREDYRHRYNEP
jgi:transcriptional regulator with XRE-family HTH domain